MPYSIENRGGKKPFKIIKDATGEVVGSSATMEEAEASVRARYAADNSVDAASPKKRKRMGGSSRGY